MSLFKTTPHDWKLIDRTILPSGYEQLRAGGQTITDLKGDQAEFFRKTLVLTFKCNVTGEIRQEKTVNP